MHGAVTHTSIPGGLIMAPQPDQSVTQTTDPEILADLAKGRMRTKIPALREALEGRFEPLHALLIGTIPAHLDFLDEQIQALPGAIEEHLVPFVAAVSCCARVRASNSGALRTSSPRSASR